MNGKGSTLLPENKGSCLQLTAEEGARLGLGQLSRKEGGVTGAKAPAVQPAALTIPLAVVVLHCEPQEP